MCSSDLAHRGDCAACHADADHLLRLKSAVRQTVQGVAVPPDLEARVGVAVTAFGGGERSGRWLARRWVALAAAAVVLAAVSFAATRPSVEMGTADALDRLALRVDDSSPVVLEGTVLCRDCELEHRYGVKANCPVIGHHGAIATADGRIWNIVEQRASASLIHDAQVLGKKIVVHGRVFRGSRALVIERYQIVS